MTVLEKSDATLLPLTVALLLSTVSGCAMFGNGEAVSSLASLSQSAVADTAESSDAEDAEGELQSVSDYIAATQRTTDDADPGPATGRTPAARLLSPLFEPPTAKAGGTSASDPVTASDASSDNPWMSGAAFDNATSADKNPANENTDNPSPFVNVQWTQPEDESVRMARAGSRKFAVLSPGDGSAFSESEQQPRPAAPPVERDRSVLDRIRGLAEPSPDRNPGAFVRRQIGRIPNPFSRFLESDEVGPQQVMPPSDDTARAMIPDVPQPVTGDLDMSGVSTENTEEIIQLLIATLDQQLVAWPRTERNQPVQPELYRRRQLDLRLARLIADQPAAAAEAIDNMSANEEEFWQELILGISQYRAPDESMAPDEQLMMTVEQLRAAVRQLEPVSSLSLRRMDFCERIAGFGMIEARRSPVFSPGDRMMIYVEVDNLATELTDFDDYRTMCSGTLELWSGSSPTETSWKRDRIEDESTSRRVDYFQSWKVSLPAHLPPGEYEMRLTLQDDLNSRRTSGRLPFTVQ